MNKLNFDEFSGFEVSKAKLHQSFQVPMHGEAETFYRTKSEGVGKAALTGVEMKFDGTILACRFKNITFGIPAANVSGFVV
jgi:hypothetical protein